MNKLNGPFPGLIINKIVEFVPPKDMCNCRLVCKLWERSIIADTIESKKLEFNQIRITVKPLGAKAFILELQKTDKIIKIKQALQDKFGTPPGQAVLIIAKCAGQLGDNYTLKEYNIITGTEIFQLMTHLPIRAPEILDL